MDTSTGKVYRNKEEGIKDLMNQGVPRETSEKRIVEFEKPVGYHFIGTTLVRDEPKIHGRKKDRLRIRRMIRDKASAIIKAEEEKQGQNIPDGRTEPLETG